MAHEEIRRYSMGRGDGILLERIPILIAAVREICSDPCFRRQFVGRQRSGTIFNPYQCGTEAFFFLRRWGDRVIIPGWTGVDDRKRLKLSLETGDVE